MTNPNLWSRWSWIGLLLAFRPMLEKRDIDKHSRICTLRYKELFGRMYVIDWTVSEEQV